MSLKTLHVISLNTNAVYCTFCELYIEKHISVKENYNAEHRFTMTNI